ncbi:1-deoxy-D-xylulose 5-phosphate reductoisomerase [Firmicutes bacterium CAG:103]|nr:1-deoxy-D-xylulose 5-phosphate reductoisomerase [Firmicutes bacterium CAG:103]
MVHSISILGSTGSIGRQTVAVAEHLGLNVRALTTNRNIQLAEEQARRLHPAFVAVTDEASAKALRIALADTDIAVGGGEYALCEAAVISDTDAVVTAVSGAVGLRPTLAAIEKGRRIALANKETLVCAGDIVMRRARECGAEIVPVDSEHSAIFQCLTGREGELHKILLTGSGGPFRGWTREQTRDVTPEMAVRHPNWSMGAKISVDSATMMNKGLEFIEAMHLFGVTPDDIQVLIHPESVAHSTRASCTRWSSCSTGRSSPSSACRIWACPSSTRSHTQSADPAAATGWTSRPIPVGCISTRPISRRCRALRSPCSARAPAALRRRS